MRFSKTATAVIAMIAMIAPTAACGTDNASSDGKTEITVWAWDNNLKANAKQFMKDNPVHVPLRLPDHADGVGTQDMAPVRIGGRRGDVDVVHGHGTQSLYGQSGLVDGQGLRIVQEHGPVRLFRHDTSRHTQSPISVGFSMVRPP